MDDTTRVAVLLVFGAMAVVGLVQLIRGLIGLITCARIMAGDEVPGRVISARTERQRTRRAGSRDRRTVLRRREVVDFRTRDGKRVQGRPWAYDGHLDADGKPINRQGQQVWVIHNRQNPEKFVAPLKRGRVHTVRGAIPLRLRCGDDRPGRPGAGLQRAHSGLLRRLTRASFRRAVAAPYR